MDDPESVGPPSLDEMHSPMAQIDPPGGQPPIEADQARVPLREEIGERGLEQETIDPLKIEPVEGDLHFLQVDQLQQEMSWMGEFNKNTLGSQDVPLQPEQSEESDPLQYIQEPPEENIKENPEGVSEEDPEEYPGIPNSVPNVEPVKEALQDVEPVEERPQDVDPEGEPRREHQVGPEDELEGDEVEADDAEDENEDEDEGDDENENENEDGDDDEDEDEDGDEDGEAVDEDVGTASPTSTITIV